MSGKYLLGNMLSALHNKVCFYADPLTVLYSGLCENVLRLMQDNGCVSHYKITNEGNKKNINVWLKIVNGNQKNINFFRLFSKPGNRVYRSVDELKKQFSYNPFSLILLSTPIGVLKIDDAIAKNVGGELLCEIF